MARLGDLLSTERNSVADFVILLAEVERRRLHLELGYPSVFTFLVENFKLTKASAFRRGAAARLVARYPVIADYLRDGRLSLTTLVELRAVLCDETHEQILDRAAGKTEDEVKDLVAALRPVPAPADLFRLLPARPAQLPLVSTGPVLEPPAVPAAAVDLAAAPDTAGRSTAPTPPDSRPAPRPPATIRPISEELRVLRVTVGRDFADDLARARSLLSHVVPNGNLEQILHECIRRTIAACEKRRRGSDRPRTRKGPPPRSERAIATDVRREVWRRDAGACAFEAPTGKRCGSTHQIEFHHLVPFARGGPSTVENLSLRCRQHNQYAAELDYGQELVREVSP